MIIRTPHYSFNLYVYKNRLYWYRTLRLAILAFIRAIGLRWVREAVGILRTSIILIWRFLMFHRKHDTTMRVTQDHFRELWCLQNYWTEWIYNYNNRELNCYLVNNMKGSINDNEWIFCVFQWSVLNVRM